MFLLISSSILLFDGCKKDMPEPPTESNTNTSGWSKQFNEYHVTFFTTFDPGNGPIYVSLGSDSGSITSYYNINPGCNASGCANFTIAPGSYAYSMVSGSIYKTGEIKTGASQCITIQL